MEKNITQLILTTESSTSILLVDAPSFSAEEPAEEVEPENAPTLSAMLLPDSKKTLTSNQVFSIL